MSFYEDLADNYDEMTRFEERLEKEKTILQRWVKRYRFSSPVDVACGTGLHAIIFAKMGLKPVGVDLSPLMLEQAKKNSIKAGAEISWRQGSMENLKEIVKENFDALFCLGNSLPHILNRANLENTFRNFFYVLNSPGISVIQLLNYSKVYNEKNRIVGIHRKNDTEYIRFYDLFEDYLVFNTLVIDWEENRSKYKLHSTCLYPYRKNELEKALLKENFTDLEFYGDMEFSPFEEEISTNLVIVAKK